MHVEGVTSELEFIRRLRNRIMRLRHSLKHIQDLAALKTVETDVSLNILAHPIKNACRMALETDDQLAVNYREDGI